MFLLFSLVLRACLFFCKSQKNKKNFFHTMGLDLGLLTWKVYVFKFSRCFWFAMIAQGAQQRAYIAKKTRKKTFPYCFWFAVIAQGARQRAYTIREGNNLRLKQKALRIRLIKYERFFFKKIKQISHCNIIPSDLPKLVFLDQTKTIF